MPRESSASRGVLLVGAVTGLMRSGDGFAVEAEMNPSGGNAQAEMAVFYQIADADDAAATPDMAPRPSAQRGP
jgi:hypothetical protein